MIIAMLFGSTHSYTNGQFFYQIGGNDQLGNIQAGYKLVSKMTGQDVFGKSTFLI